jgi:NhaA family Na+:H+ antiporter
VNVVDGPPVAEVLADPVVIGIVVGLVLGKPIGIVGASWLTARFARAELDGALTWGDLGGMSMVAGIGFTVSLLVGDLAFGGTERIDAVRLAVLGASLASALLAALTLRRRNAAYRALSEAEEIDTDHDDIPDVYQPGR